MATVTLATIHIEIPITIEDKDEARRVIKDHVRASLKGLSTVASDSPYHLTCNFHDRVVFDYAEAAEAWFKKNRDELVRDHYGKWICLHFDTVVGVYPTKDEAIYNGYDFCVNSFIVKHIVPREEEVVHAIPGSRSTVGDYERAGYDLGTD